VFLIVHCNNIHHLDAVSTTII